MAAGLTTSMLLTFAALQVVESTKGKGGVGLRRHASSFKGAGALNRTLPTQQSAGARFGRRAQAAH